MLRLKITVEDVYFHRFDGWFEVKDQLADLGWEIGRDLDYFDFEMVQSQVLMKRLAEGVDALARPLIVYERSGSASINPTRLRELIQNPMVLGYAKETGFRDKATYNKPHLQGRYHHTLLSDLPADVPLPVLSDNDLEKIETIFQIYAHKERYIPTRSRKRNKWTNRVADVFFSGNTEYEVSLITDHRHLCCEQLSKLRGINTLLGVGKSLRSEVYASALHDSKILVSPYGYGEYSWKDFEAIYCGCIVIKALSDFVTTHGFDIYEKGAYTISCRPDFSDLPDVIDRVLSNPRASSKFAAKAQKALNAAAAETEQRSKDIAGFLNKCVARIS